MKRQDGKIACKDSYLKGKKYLTQDKSICNENQKLYLKFFEEQEYKLKRKNSLSELDSATYKTLLAYVIRFKNIQKWFNNKPIVQLNKKDIKRVYDDLEDGKITNARGNKFASKNDYYDKVFKSTLFKLAKKDNLAREVIQYYGEEKQEVRFITEDDFNKIINNAFKPLQKLLLYLAWDIGENINALLQLKKSDFYKQKNPDTDESEYRVNLRKEILKRSRRSRSEITNYNETVQLLDQLLPDYKEHDLIFGFGYGTGKKIISRAVERAGVKCIPNGESVTWKDLRSGMACNLLKKGWSIDEVNARLGHKPSSDEIDKYINFLALDRHIPKKKVQEFTINKLKSEIEQSKERERLQALRMENMQKQMKVQQDEMKHFKENVMQDLTKDILRKIGKSLPTI